MHLPDSIEGGGGGGGGEGGGGAGGGGGGNCFSFISWPSLAQTADVLSDLFVSFHSLLRVLEKKLPSPIFLSQT